MHQHTTERRRVPERGADGFFDRGVGDVQSADAVPLGGVAAEIILRGGGADGASRSRVAGDDRIVRIEPGNEGAGDIGDAAALAQAKERPGSLAIALHQSGLGEEPQMAVATGAGWR